MAVKTHVVYCSERHVEENVFSVESSQVNLLTSQQPPSNTSSVRCHVHHPSHQRPKFGLSDFGCKAEICRMNSLC